MTRLSVRRLHMGNEGVSLREPLQTLSAGPAGGLHAGSALLLSLFPGSAAVFHLALPLLLRYRVGVLVSADTVCPEAAAALPLSHHAPRVNTLQKQRESPLVGSLWS